VKKEVLDEKLKAQGFGTLLLMQITGSKKEPVQVPGTRHLSSDEHRHVPAGTPLSDLAGILQQGIYHDIFTKLHTEEEYALAEANLYDVSTEKLILTVATETKVGGKCREDDQGLRGCDHGSDAQTEADAVGAHAGHTA